MQHTHPQKYSGLLTKRGHFIKNWKLRWFVLEKGKLGYFKDGDPSTSLDNHNGRSLQGVFPLENVICGGRTTDDPLKIYLVDLNTEKELYMRASNSKEASEWEEHIKAHAEFAKHGYSIARLAATRRQSASIPAPEKKTSVNRISTDSTADGSLSTDYADTALLQFENFEENSSEPDHSEDVENIAVEMDICTNSSLSASLVEIAKKIKQLESESRVEQENDLKEFNKTSVPVFKMTIKDLDLRIQALKKRIKSEHARGEEHISSLEEELDGYVATQDQTKCKLYFPTSRFSLGSGGVYCAFDDIWIEKLSGRFNVQLLPTASEVSSQIVCLLNGVSDGDVADGVSTRLLIGGFKLKGDSGKGVPPLSFDHLELAITFNVTIVLTFNEDTKRWTSPSDQFRVNIVSFKGPFGISRGLVSTILSVAIPIIKHLLLSTIPEEVGLLLRTLPTHTKVAGDFSISGTLPIFSLSDYMHNSKVLCDILDLSPNQVKFLLLMQKSMQRGTILKSILHLVEYKRSLEKYEQWEQILAMWDRAAVVYFNGLSAQNPDIAHEVISFRKIIQGVEQVLKNELHISVELTKLEGAIGLLSLNSYTRTFVERIMNQAISGRKKLSDAQFSTLSKIFNLLNIGNDAVEMVARSLDYMRLSLGVKLSGGPEGDVRILLQEVEAQTQMSIWSALPKEMNMGFDYIIPMMINMQTRKQGSIDIKVFHCGSKEMLEATKFARFLKTEDASVQQSTSLNHASDIRMEPLPEGSTMESYQQRNYDKYANAVTRLERNVKVLLDQSPGPLEAHQMTHVRVTGPKILFVVDDNKAVSLEPGAPLFILQVGPTHSTSSERSGMADLGGDFMGIEEQQAEEDPCSMTIQTASKIRVQALIPDIRVHIPLPALLRYINDHFGDIDRLSCFLATVIPSEREDLVKYIHIFHQLFEFINKLLLVPDALDLSVHLAVDIISCEEEGLQIWIKPPDTRCEEASGVGNDKPFIYPVKLSACVHVGDIVQDIIRIVQSFMAVQEADDTPTTHKYPWDEGDNEGPPLPVVQYTIRVTSIKCLSLKNVESILGGKNDPYVRMRVGDKSFETTQKMNAGATCEWSLGNDPCIDDFEFTLTDLELNADKRTFDVEINVFDWNKRTAHVHIGGGFDRVSLTTNVDCGCKFSFDVDLQTKKYIPAGVVEVGYEISSFMLEERSDKP